MNVNLILAHTPDDFCVGVNDEGGHRLPWKVPNDMARFKKLTSQHVVIMGHTTFKAIGRAAGLPNRINLVLTRDETLRQRNMADHPDFHPNLYYVTDFGGAIEMAHNLTRKGVVGETDAIWVMGGKSVYETALAFNYRTEITGIRLGDLHVSIINADRVEKELDPETKVCMSPEFVKDLTRMFSASHSYVQDDGHDYYVLQRKPAPGERAFTPCNSLRHRITTLLDRATGLVEEAQQLNEDMAYAHNLTTQINALEELSVIYTHLQKSHPHDYYTGLK